MMHLTLDQVTNITKGKLHTVGEPVVEVTGAVIDSRELTNGNLFIAFNGENVDGHDYLQAAQAAGAAAALVERWIDIDLPQVVVTNTQAALWALAKYWREQFELPVIGITGSNGKTTVKEMLASILTVAGQQILVTKGNRNNELGLPLMLLELEPQHQAAVLEMGAGQPGDIRLLASLAQPHIGVITHIGPAHIERLGSVYGVAQTKAELFACLPDDGVAIYPQQAEHVEVLEQAAGERTLMTFNGLSSADVHWQINNQQVSIHHAGDKAKVQLQVPGRHNISNATAATSAALAMGVSLADIAQGLSAYQGYRGRFQRKAGMYGSVIIDDTYNANPGSLAAALETLAETDSDRERWLAMGDMGELGNHGAQLHMSAGQQARASGVSRLFASGDLCRNAISGFGEGAEHFGEQAMLIEALQNALHSQVSLLVKGSRSASMETVVKALTLSGQTSQSANHGSAS